MVHYCLMFGRRVVTSAGIFVCLLTVLSQVSPTTETRGLPVDSFQRNGSEHEDHELEMRPCGLERRANSMRASYGRLDE